jgi:PEGA domain
LLARIAKRFTAWRPYICDSCGWHGWRAPSGTANLSPQVPLQARDSATVDPVSPTIGEAARRSDMLDVFHSEKPASQEGIRDTQPDTQRQAAIAATPPLGSPTEAWTTRALNSARRLLHRQPYERFLSGIRRYRPWRLEAPRAEVIRVSGFFALGLAVGAFVVWSVSKSAQQPPPADTSVSMGTSGMTGTRPADLPPSTSALPAPALDQTSSLDPSLESARAGARVRRKTAVVSPRSAPSTPERQSTRRTQPAARPTRDVVRATATSTLARPPGSLAIDSDPQGAQVSVNGRGVGSTPLVLNDLPAGTHLVRVEANGYQAWAWTARVVANQRNRLTVRLLSSTNRAVK